MHLYVHISRIGSTTSPSVPTDPYTCTRSCKYARIRACTCVYTHTHTTLHARVQVSMRVHGHVLVRAPYNRAPRKDLCAAVCHSEAHCEAWPRGLLAIAKLPVRSGRRLLLALCGKVTAIYCRRLTARVAQHTFQRVGQATEQDNGFRPSRKCRSLSQRMLRRR